MRVRQVVEGPAGLLNRDIGGALTAWARTPWRPHSAASASRARRFTTTPVAVPTSRSTLSADATTSPAVAAYESRYAPYLFAGTVGCRVGVVGASRGPPPPPPPNSLSRFYLQVHLLCACFVLAV